MSNHATESPQNESFQKRLKDHCIVITGGIATGKSTVANILKKLGYIVIDADEIARAVTTSGHPCLAKIVEAFGQGVLLPSGDLDRQKMRNIIFSNPDKKLLLESITHPAIGDEFKTQVQRLHPIPEIFFYEATLIFEAKRNHLFKEIWATYCPQNVQIQRLITRSNISEHDAKNIISGQLPADQKAKLANHTIDTSGTVADVEEKVKNMLRNWVE
jgi:dephospho-CoA kinase